MSVEKAPHIPFHQPVTLPPAGGARIIAEGHLPSLPYPSSPSLSPFLLQVVRVSMESAALSITSASACSDMQAEFASLDVRFAVPHAQHTLGMEPLILCNGPQQMLGREPHTLGTG